MDETIRGMHTCEACGRQFALMHEDRYTVRNKIPTLDGLLLSKEVEPPLMDAFDCPYCGCQNRVASRWREFEGAVSLVSTVPLSECDPDDDECCGCPIQELCSLGDSDDR